MHPMPTKNPFRETNRSGLRARLRFSSAALLLLCLTAAGCADEPAGQAGNTAPTLLESQPLDLGDQPRAPLYRLTESLASGPIAPEDLTCAIGNEIRPSLGCLPQIPLFSGPLPGKDDEQLQIAIPPTLARQTLVLERSTKKTADLDWRSLSPEYLEKNQPFYQFNNETSEDDLLQIWARPLPPHQRHFRTYPQHIPAGASLQVGLGIATLATAVGAAPVQMQLDIETSDGLYRLIDTRLDAQNADSWQNHEINLAAFADQQVSFHFVSNVLHGGATGKFSAPLWGAPVVVAPVEAVGPPNIIVISLDTLRADYVGREKEGRALTPNLDRFRKTGAIFDNAMTTYPSTTGSHMSLFTGVYPATHETIHARKVLPREIPTMAETLAQHRYATAAFTENAMLNAGSGFLRGFDFYQEQKGDDVWSTEGAIEKTFNDALTWLDGHPHERFFLFLHTYQVHFPYTPPDRHNHFRKNLKGKLPEETLARQAFWSEAGYAGEIIYMDTELGALLEAFGERIDLENTMIIITADHGEEFAEHGHIGHAETLHSEVLDIPLSIHYPGRIAAGTRVRAPASLVDILPTVLDFAGLPPQPGAQGVSLRGWMEGHDSVKPRAVYAQNYGKNGQQWAARTIDRKFIFTGNQKVPGESYDLTSDPEEKMPLTITPEDLTASKQLIGVYKEWVIEAMSARMLRKKQEQAPARPLDEDVANKLRALGYVD